MRRRALTLALLLAGCARAPATLADLPPLTPPATQREQQADFAAKLFMESCVAHLTKPEELTRWIQERGLRRADPAIESKLLAGMESRKGEAWSATGSLGAFLLLVVPIEALSVNQCSVWAQRADVERLTQHFERLLLGTVRPGIELERVSDGTVQGPGGDVRQVVYFLRKQGDELGWVFAATTSRSEQAETQGLLMLSPGHGRNLISPSNPRREPPAETR